MPAFDFATLRGAIERSDAERLVSLYHDDAEMTIVDRQRTPSKPERLVGKPAIAAFLRDVCGRAMSHEVGQEVVGTDRASYVERCVYPDGCGVVAAMVLDFRDGKIARHFTVQAWDETK